MSDLTSMLRHEQRRHFAMSSGLVIAAVIAGTMVTNERGVFTNLPDIGAFSALADAFSSLADTRNPLLFHRNAANGPGAGPLGGNPFGAPPPAVPGIPGVPGIGALPPVLANPLAPLGFAPGGFPIIPLNNIGNPGGGGVPSGGPPLSPLGPSLPPQVVPEETPPVTPVPEPAIWALLIGGFGLVGAMQRRFGRLRRLSLAD